MLVFSAEVKPATRLSAISMLVAVIAKDILIAAALLKFIFS